MVQSNQSRSDFFPVTSNQEYVLDALMLLQRGLGPFVQGRIAAVHPGVSPIDAARDYMDIFPRLSGRPISDWDAHGLLTLMLRSWNDVFRATMGQTERSYVSELLQTRNRWAHEIHQNPFSTKDAHRVWDTTYLLLNAISAREAELAESIGDKLLQVLADEERQEQEASEPPPRIIPIPALFDPWDKVKHLKVGDVVEGKVRSIKDFGAFVEVNGFSALLHISQMSTTELVRHPSEKVAVGQIVQVYIIALYHDKKKVSLGMRRPDSNPWKDVVESCTPGTVVEGIVRTIKDFGAFLEIKPGVTGLLHKSEISWTKSPRHPRDLSICEHQEIAVMILSVDENEQRIDLGYKQTKPNPWDRLSVIYGEGSIHPAKVVSIQEKGIVAELSHDVEVFVLWEELRNAGQDKSSAYREGDELNLCVTGMDPDGGKLTMSEVACEDFDPEPEEPKPVFPPQPSPPKPPPFVLPKPEERALGKCPATGNLVFLKKDADGYYVQLGEGDKPRRTPIHPKMMEPYEVTLDIARQLIGLPREIGIHPETRQTIRAGVGRSGPCVRMGDTYASLGRDDDLFSISLRRAVELIDAKKLTRLLGLHPRTREKVWAELGPDGPFVRMGETFASLEGRDDLSAMTLEWAVELIDATSRWL